MELTGNKLRENLHEALTRVFPDISPSEEWFARFESYVIGKVEYSMSECPSDNLYSHHIKHLLGSTDKDDFKEYLAPFEWAAAIGRAGFEVTYGGEGEPDLYIQVDDVAVPVEVYTPREKWHSLADWIHEVIRVFERTVTIPGQYSFFPEVPPVMKKEPIKLPPPQDVGSFFARIVNKVKPCIGEFLEVYSESSPSKRALGRTVVLRYRGVPNQSPVAHFTDLVKSVFVYDTCQEFTASFEITPRLGRAEDEAEFLIHGVNKEIGSKVTECVLTHFLHRSPSDLLNMQYGIRFRNMPESLTGELLADMLLGSLERVHPLLPMYTERVAAFFTLRALTDHEPSDRVLVALRNLNQYDDSVDFRTTCWQVQYRCSDLHYRGRISFVAQDANSDCVEVVSNPGAGGVSDGTRLSKRLSDKARQLPKDRGGLLAVTAPEGFDVNVFEIHQLLGRVGFEFNPVDKGSARRTLDLSTCKAAGMFANCRWVFGVLFGSAGPSPERQFNAWGYTTNLFSRSKHCDDLATALGVKRWYKWVIVNDGNLECELIGQADDGVIL